LPDLKADTPDIPGASDTTGASDTPDTSQWYAVIALGNLHPKAEPDSAPYQKLNIVYQTRSEEIATRKVATQ